MVKMSSLDSGSPLTALVSTFARQIDYLRQWRAGLLYDKTLSTFVVGSGKLGQGAAVGSFAPATPFVAQAKKKLFRDSGPQQQHQKYNRV